MSDSGGKNGRGGEAACLYCGALVCLPPERSTGGPGPNLPPDRQEIVICPTCLLENHPEEYLAFQKKLQRKISTSLLTGSAKTMLTH